MNRLAMVVLLAAAALAGVLHANAQPVTTIYSFAHGPATPLAGLTLGPDGNFYGTAQTGGLYNDGILFKMTTNGTMTTLVNFSGYVNGASPQANLTLGPDGNFYGTTSGGGTNGSGVNATGTVFKTTTNGIVTVLVNFNGLNGGIPLAGVTLGPDGNFYGTTEYGGLYGDGTVFKMATNGTLTTLVSFNTTNGANPTAGLAAGPGGNLYGTTRIDGTNGNFGTVFRVTTNGTFATLFNFAGTNGASPYGGVILGPDGNLYGTTESGYYPNGAFCGGTIFELTTNGMLTTLVRMSGFFGSIEGTSNSVVPYAGLTLGPDGNFYGSTYGGGTNGNGTVFQVTTNGSLATLTRAGIPYLTYYNSFGVEFYSTNEGNTIAEVFNGTLTTLYSFSAQTNYLNTDGFQPQATVAFGPDGYIYGTASRGGTNGYGTVFKVTTNGSFSTLASFSGNNGGYPMDALTLGPNGSFYGTANSGGTLDYGTIFKFTPGGTATTVVNFDRANDGANPQAGLIPGPGGNFYGTAAGGGDGLLYLGNNTYDAVSDGTAFEITTNGVFTTLVDFNGTNGANPYGGLAVGLDGNLYGTTTYGGISNDGVIFLLQTNGTLTALTNFIGANGANPFASLTLGLDGNFYGTCEGGGDTNGDGTVFQVKTNGTLTTLIYFNGATNGANPNDSLLLGPDGNFYGTTFSGGAGNHGTVFKVTPGGTLTTLVNFAQTNGEFPVGGLALGPDGYFYGTTELGGIFNNAGTVFKMATNGTLTTLYSFVYSPLSSAGNYPFAALTLATNDNFIHFYGTTYNGGSGGGGTIFRLDLSTAYSVPENTTNTFFPLTNDAVWAAGGTLGLVSAIATNGTAQISGSGITFTPAANFTGTATIDYTVTDHAGDTNHSLITVLVTNIPPVANPDFYAVAENSSANVFSPLTNDVLATSGGTLSLVSVSPTNGTAAISGTNVLFTPQANFLGTATIGYTITDNIGGTNTSLITVTVTNPPSPDADLSLTATGPGAPVASGGLLNYSLTVSNAGPATATDVVISNQLPAGVTFVSATGGATPTNGVLLINLGSLALGAMDTAQIVVQPTVAGQLTNLFEVSASQTDPILINNTATVVSTVTNAPVNSEDLSITASAAPEPVGVGSNLVYSIIVSNATFFQAAVKSNVPEPAATDVTVSNRIPAGVTFISATGGAVPTNGLLLINLGSLAAGQTNGVQIIEQPAVAGKLTNMFGVFADQPDPVPSNNIASVISTVTNSIPAVVDLSISGSAAPNPVGTGNDLTYSLTVSNGAAAATATDVTISNPFPANLVFVSATGGAMPSDSLLLINLGTLPAGATTNVQIVVETVDPGLLTNVFTVYADQPNIAPSNTAATVVTTVTNIVAVPLPGTPISWGDNTLSVPAVLPYGGEDGYPYSIATYYAERNALFGDMYGNFTTAVPGDVVLLFDINGGDSQTNWAAVVKFFNSADPNGTNGLPATFFEPFLASDTVSNGFADFKLFTNVLYLKAVAGVFLYGESEYGSTNEVGPLAGLAADQFAELSYSAIPRTICTITSPVSGQQVSNMIFTVMGTTMTFSGQQVTNVTYQLNGGAWTTNTATANGWTNWSVVVNLTPGSNTVQAFAVDTDGIPTATNSVTFDYVPPPVDVALSIISAPNPVDVGNALTYSLTATNNSPTTATGVVVSNTLPANVTFESALPSQGSAANSGSLVTYAVGNLPNGVAATLAIVVIPNAAGLLTNKAIIYSTQNDSVPANNSVTNLTTAVSVPITNLVATALSGITLNKQTGLFEQQVEVSNGGPNTPASVLLLVNGLTGSATLYNATGKTNGVPYVQSAGSLGVGSNIIFLLEYYVPTRVMPTNLRFTVEAGPPVNPPVITGTIMSISRTVDLPGGDILVEFAAIPGRIYAVQYSSDMVTWQTAVPVITAPANRVQWIDAGPPQTASSPASATSRYYRVVLLP